MVSFHIIRQVPQSPEHQKKLLESPNPYARNLVGKSCLKCVAVVKYNRLNPGGWRFNYLVKTGQITQALLCAGIREVGKYWVVENKWDKIHRHRFKEVAQSGELCQSDLHDLIRRKSKPIRGKPETHYEIVSPIAYPRPDTQRNMLLDLFKI